MLDVFIELFTTIFTECLHFDFIIYLLSGLSLIVVFISIFLYVVKGKY